MKRRLLLVTYDYPPRRGGIATYAAELAEAWSRKRPGSVTVLTPAGPHASSPGLHIQSCGSGGALGSLPGLLAGLLQALRADPDAFVFCTNWYPAGLVAWALSRWKKFPYYVAVHGGELLDRPSWKSFPRRFLRRRVLSGASALFPVSRYTAQRLAESLASPHPKTLVTPNGVNPLRFAPAPSQGFAPWPVVLTVCRLESHKGVDTALQALALLAAEGMEFEYRVVGSGEARGGLEKMAQDLGLEKRVHFLGAASDDELRRHYAECDLFLLLSREQSAAVEGFGLVFLEAAASGKTAVGTRSGGIPDAVEHERTGLLVEANNPQAAAAALRRLLVDPNLRNTLAANACQRARSEMSWDAVAGRLLERMEARP